jgi:N-acetylglucosaminyldiphosphoundecaprenol N-acetyl-beta-D-mannosaminyltransferase
MAKILDVKIDELDFKQVMRKIADFCLGKRLRQIVTVNPEFIVAAQHDGEFKKILNAADLSVPDGFGLKIGARLSGQKIGERITGVDLTWEIAKLASERGWSLFLLGGKAGVAYKTAQRLKLVHPKLKIAGTYAGSPQEEGIIKKINSTKPDILLVAFGAPKQEKFIYNYRTRLNVKAAMGIGGTFDFISGTISRAPKWMRALGLEWLYRLIRQPKRLGRIFTAVVKFPLLVLWGKIKLK